MILHTPDNKLMIAADARAVGITTARTTSQRRDPRTTDHQTHPVLSYNPTNGIDRDHASIYVRPYTPREQRSAAPRTSTASTRAAHDTALMAAMGSIHQDDN